MLSTVWYKGPVTPVQKPHSFCQVMTNSPLRVAPILGSELGSRDSSCPKEGSNPLFIFFFFTDVSIDNCEEFESYVWKNDNGMGSGRIALIPTLFCLFKIILIHIV